MRTSDIILLVAMAVAAAVAAGAFASIAGYLFDRGLADRRQAAPNIFDFYRAYTRHTRHTRGRIGRAFWIHVVAAGLFITLGMAYTITRWIIPALG